MDTINERIQRRAALVLLTLGPVNVGVMPPPCCEDDDIAHCPLLTFTTRGVPA